MSAIFQELNLVQGSADAERAAALAAVHLYSERMTPDELLHEWQSHGMLGYGLLAPTYGLIAASALEGTNTPDWKLDTLVVDPEHRGKGYGSLLLRSIEERALSLGAVTLRALPPLFDDRVARFYGHQGYTLMPDSKFKKVLGVQERR